MSTLPAAMLKPGELLPLHRNTFPSGNNTAVPWRRPVFAGVVARQVGVGSLRLMTSVTRLG
ncbi:MAG: hypothetical protein ACKODH_16040 [Limisphaerales bacterium]